MLNGAGRLVFVVAGRCTPMRIVFGVAVERLAVYVTPRHSISGCIVRTMQRTVGAGSGADSGAGESRRNVPVKLLPIVGVRGAGWMRAIGDVAQSVRFGWNGGGDG